MEMRALRGTIVHKHSEIHSRSGTWAPIDEIDGYKKLITFIAQEKRCEDSTRINRVKNLFPEQCNFKGFMDAYGENITFEFIERWVIDKTLGYCGTMDRRGIWQGKRAIFDIKTSSSYGKEYKLECGAQMAGYDLADRYEAEVYVIIPLNPSNTCGYGAPIVLDANGPYKDYFLQKLAEFKQLINACN